MQRAWWIRSTGLREILEEDEGKKGHPSLTQQATKKNVQEDDEQVYHPILPQQQATRKNVQEGDEQMYHPNLHNNRQLQGLSGYQHNTSQAISVRKDKRKPLKRRH